MNILYLCADTGIPIRGDKGAAVHVRALTDALVRAGHTVTIATPRPGPADGPAPNATITEVGGDWGIRGLSEALVSAAARLLEQSPYDFIYERYSLWSDAGARLARESGLPLVLEVNAPLRLEAAQYRQLSDPETAAAIEATQFQAAQAISVVSEPLRQYVISRGAAPERVHVLPNAVDPTHFHPAVRGGAIHHRYNLGDRIIVGFVGRPRPWHDLDTLLEAFAQLHATDSRYHLLLVGRMPDDLPGRLAAKGLSGAATLTGPVPHLDIPQYIAAMDVAVSTHAPEDPATPFYFSPLKLFEYLAVGVPTVAADVGQPGEIMRKVAGGRWQAASANYQLPMTLYPPGNVEALAGRIRYLVENPAEAREVAWRGATYVLQNHTWDGNAQAVISWIPGRGEATGGGSIHDPDYCLPVASPLRRTPILDDKLRQRLYRATRPDLAGPLLARHLRPAWKKEFEPAPAVTNITVLKYKPGRRCVLAYQLPGRSRNGQPAASRPVIGKVFRDERGERLLALQEFLWRDGFGPQAADKIYVPRPLAYVPEMRMLVQEQAAGATLNQLVEDPGLPKLVRRSAEGLAKLHNTPAPAPAGFPLDAYTLASERVNLDRFTADLATMRPADAAAVARLRDALQAWATQLPDPPALTPVHRDFYYSQVLFDEARLTLIDFDLLALGDPALDVANFTAHLYFLGLDRLGHLDALAKEAELFQAVYGRYRPLDATFTQRLHFYQTATFFRLLNVVAPRPGLAQHFETLYTHTAGLINLLES